MSPKEATLRGLVTIPIESVNIEREKSKNKIEFSHLLRFQFSGIQSPKLSCSWRTVVPPSPFLWSISYSTLNRRDIYDPLKEMTFSFKDLKEKKETPVEPKVNEPARRHPVGPRLFAVGPLSLDLQLRGPCDNGNMGKIWICRSV